jgi:arylformamidase
MSQSIPVWQAYDRTKLDAEYNAAATVPSLDVYLERYAVESARVRAAYECRTGIPYGPGEREVLDVFPARRAGAPVVVYLHGGYWRRLSKDDFDFVAEPLVRAGVAVVVPSYSLAPAATLDEIVRQMRTALAWVHGNAPSFNADPGRVTVSGHSAGGQLAGMLVSTPWSERGIPDDLVKGVFGISGLYDLEPVRRSNVNEWLQLDEVAAARNSPSVHLPRTPARLTAIAGGNETSEFRRQTLDFAERWKAAGWPAESRIFPGLHHYDIVLELLDGDSAVTRTLLDLVEAGGL